MAAPSVIPVPARLVSATSRPPYAKTPCGGPTVIGSLAGQSHPEIVDHQRIALDDVDDEHDVAAVVALSKRELDAREEPGAEQPIAGELDLGIVDVEEDRRRGTARSGERREHGCACCRAPRRLAECTEAAGARRRPLLGLARRPPGPAWTRGTASAPQPAHRRVA